MTTTPAINPLLLDTGTPPIPAARSWLEAYDGRLGPLINLSQAVPGTPPPDEMLQRLAAAAGSASTAGYGAIRGDAALLDIYAEHVSGIYDAAIHPAEIAITSGCNEAFFVAMLAVAKAGDAVMLPSPWYFNHQMTLRMLGITVLVLPTQPDRGFVPDPDAASRLIDVHRKQHPGVPVKAIVLVTPNNPTGAVYPAETIARFGTLAVSAGCWLVLDETYRDFLPAASMRAHDLYGAPTARRHLIQLYSFSKAYCIPGHRAGAMIATTETMDQIGKVLDCMQICAPRTPQAALTWAIPALARWRAQSAIDISRRAQAFVRSLAAAPQWNVDSIGAYFAYVRHPMKGARAEEVARDLAVRGGILALPGSYFGPGQDEFLRFAFANVDDAAVADVGQRLAHLSAA